MKDFDLTFTYSELNEAKFNDIRVLYKIEQHSTIKQAHRLSSMVCWPTSLERQNVNLILKVFNESTYAALKIQNDLHPDSINDTSNFVDVQWSSLISNCLISKIRLLASFFSLRSKGIGIYV